MLHWSEMDSKRIFITADFKLMPAKMFRVNKTQNSSKNFKAFWRVRFGRSSVVRPPSNGKGLSDIKQSMITTLDTRFHI